MYKVEWTSKDLEGIPGKETISIADGALDTASTSLALASAYPQENALRLLENFASATAPANPTIGQIWFDYPNNELKVFDAAQTWASIGGGGGGSVSSVGVASSTISVSGSPITSTGTITINLQTSGVGAGSYTLANITVDAYGRITAASNGSAGSGTVSSVAVSGNNGIGVAGSPITSTGTITLSLGAITPTSVAASGTVSGSNLSGTHTGSSSGTNTGDQTITLTGDVTGSGDSSFATTLANSGVSAGSYVNANITVDAKGRITAASNGSAATGPVYVYKAAQTGRNSTTTVAADPDLVFTNLPTGTYAFEAVITYSQNSGLGQGLKYNFTGTNTSMFSPINLTTPNNTNVFSNWQTANVYVPILSSEQINHVTGSSPTDTTILVKGTLVVSNASNSFSFNWSQSVSNATNTYVQARSYMKAERMGA